MTEQNEERTVNVTVSPVIKSRNFTCAMTRPDVNSLKDPHDIYDVCEAFQSCVHDVTFKRTKDGTIMTIMVNNFVMPDKTTTIWSNLGKLFDDDGASYVTIYNYDTEGQALTTERYVLEDIELTRVLSHEDNLPQRIKIDGMIVREEVI